MAETLNLKLHLPEGTDRYSIEVFNDNFKAVDAAFDELTALELKRLKIATTVWQEAADTTATARHVEIPGVTNLDDILNVPIYIKSQASGSSGTAVTLKINSLGEDYIYFATPGVASQAATSARIPRTDLWTRKGGVYVVVWDGSRYLMTNQQMDAAGTDSHGLVKMIYDMEAVDETGDAVATAFAVKTYVDDTIGTLSAVLAARLEGE